MKSSAAAVESIPENVGRYRVSRQLAVGGMGAIYEAFDTLARRQVAYKRLKVANESERARRTALFEREYNALRQLKHPNIVEVYDYGFDSDGPFYTMELLPGSDLASMAPLTPVEVCRVVRDVASALALLHARRLVHRDVTPANVRMSPDGRAKLIDFGALSTFGVAKEIVGTAAYVAPECLAGEALDGRTDLFSLGALCYWLLTQRQAYPARHMGDLLEAWELPVAAPSHYREGSPQDLDRLVLSLLEREPVARPASAAHVIERLTAVAGLAPQHDEREVAYSYLLHPPLVGREATLARLKQLAADAGAGRGTAVMIQAGPGMGRSALLDRVAIEAQLAGANVLRFQPTGKRDGGLAHALTRWLRALDPELWRELRTRHAVLGRETRGPLEAVLSPAQVSLERSRMVSAIHACVEALSQRAPLTILVDDVQHADAESLAMLASLARSSASLSLLLVITMRESAQASDPNALLDLRAVATALPLAPLSELELTQLLEMVFGKVSNTLRLARLLAAHSGGIPGQCMDLCRLLLDKQEIRYALGTFVLPFDPRADNLGTGGLELTRLSGLSDGALALARLLSMHDGALGTLAAAGALACEEQHVFSAAQELDARSLLQILDGALALSSQSLRAAIAASLDHAAQSKLRVVLARTIMRHAEPSIENRFAACHHLLLAGEEDEAVELVWSLLRDTMIPNGSVSYIVPVLEALLAVLRKRGHSDEQCWPVLWPLVIAGFWGELGAGNRHRDAAIYALARLTGIALAARLAPIFGKRLSLTFGILYGVVRFLCTPRRFRAPSYRDLMQRFFSSVTMSTATASASFEPATALRIAGLLDPIAAMKEGTPAHIAREFALATAELGAGKTDSSSKRYERLIALLNEDRPALAEVREGFLDGSVHGRAQAVVSSGSPAGLRAGEELLKRHPFFAPHAETIKMTFYGYRGEKEPALEHRRKAELLALQGGLSWSAFTVLTFRNAYIAMMTRDTLGVVEASVELERMANIAPNMLVFRDLCQAYVALSGGHPREALAIYERCAALPDAHVRPAFEVFAALQAEALVELGRLEEAKRVCEEGLHIRSELGIPHYALRALHQALALVDARLGQFTAAKQRLAMVAEEVASTEAALPIGSVQRDRARVALLEGDSAEFSHYFEAMLVSFKGTRNPSLIQQCRKLLAEAVRAGLVEAPSWEKHGLTAAGNTQDVASGVPEVTELI